MFDTVDMSKFHEIKSCLLNTGFTYDSLFNRYEKCDVRVYIEDEVYLLLPTKTLSKKPVYVYNSSTKDMTDEEILYEGLTRGANLVRLDKMLEIIRGL
jgi:hypothetical protein